MTIKLFSSKSEAIAGATNHFLETAQQAINERGQFGVALSGGSTPKAIYKELAAQPDALDWTKVILFWSDERAVPPDHEDSNFRMAMDAGFSKLPVQHHRMQAETDIEVHAAAYESLINSHLDGVFDLCMLGMGPDGHTASLFPDTLALTERTKLVVPNHIPQKDSWRMTCTFPCINASRQTVIYVLGEEKRPMLTEIFSHPDIYPIEQVKNPTWFTDVDLGN